MAELRLILKYLVFETDKESGVGKLDTTQRDYIVTINLDSLSDEVKQDLLSPISLYPTYSVQEERPIFWKYLEDLLSKRHNGNKCIIRAGSSYSIEP